MHFRLGAPGAHNASNAVAALLAVAAVDGDVLNAAAALSNFHALKGRGARIDLKIAGENIRLIDESYNANPSSMAAALGNLGNGTGETAHRGLGRHAGAWRGRGKPACGPRRAIEDARADLVFLNGAAMAALWDAIPASRRGAYGAKSADIADALINALRDGDTVLVKGSFGSKMAVIVEALKARAGGMMFHYFLVPLSEHSGVLNVFRYITFRAAGAIATALLIAFMVGPRTINWLRVRQGKGQPIRADGPQRHVVEKQGTPTMGGLIILVPSIIATLLWADLTDPYVWIAVFVTVSFGLLGF